MAGWHVLWVAASGESESLGMANAQVLPPRVAPPSESLSSRRAGASQRVGVVPDHRLFCGQNNLVGWALAHADSDHQSV
jgi:hypothetical protein